MTRTIFVSSVQGEFAVERRAIKDYVTGDPLLSRHFDVFIFEDTPAETRGPEEVFLDEVDRCFVYLGLFGETYGGIDANGVSATEREFDRAVMRRKERLVFHKAGTSSAREEKQKAFVTKADAQLTRRSFRGVPDLQGQLYASLVRILENEGLISNRPFDARAARANMSDLDEQRILAVIEQAGRARNFTLRRPTSAKEALRHLNLLDGEVPSHAAVILFAPESRRIVSSAFITCLHFAGTESARPILSQNVVHGPLFDQIDTALDFVMARLARPVGTREESARLESGFEIPRPAVAEAIINAVAHRDYASGSAVHVRVFADRVEVASPGQLPRSLTPEQLTRAHPSIPGNPLIAEVLFLAGYVERAGTGTIDILNQCRAAGLPDPDFFQDGDQWIVRLWRDWLNEGLLTGLGLNNRQIAALLAGKATGYLTTQRYIEVAGTSRPTAKRDLEELVALELLQPEGSGRAARYRISRNRLKNGSIGSSPERDANGS